MPPKKGRYSWLIRPLLIGFDIVAILLFLYLLLTPQPYSLYLYSVFCWLILGYIIHLYKIYRFTTLTTIFNRLLGQFIAFSITHFAYLGITGNQLPLSKSLTYLAALSLSIAVSRIALFYALKKYRAYLKGNIRNVIIVGSSPAALELQKLFTEKADLGYQLKGFFGKEATPPITGDIAAAFEFLKTSSIDEIYCVAEELTDEELNKWVEYANEHYRVLKFIPDAQEILSRRLSVTYYGYLPVVSMEEMALNKPLNRLLKRTFDLVFSFLVILLILSWLIPLMYILIKIESRGPLFYKHPRNGINYAEFMCYKFRSMKHQANTALEQVHKEDGRVTPIGRFIRRTSIDEMPQFINVFLGQMSVVGPRPHPTLYTKNYARQIDKYNFIFRHSVKPGVSGLAQVKGYRGEIQAKEDIVNRIKYDIFYIENWSLLLDLRIIAETIFLLFKGQEKAY